MATIIDALVVTLGLDSSKFKSGSKDVTEEMKKQKKEAEKLAKDMQEAGKRAAGFFTAIRTEVIALAGVSLSLYGVKNFVTEMTQGLTKLSVASKALDLTPKQLEGWTGAAEAVGSSSEKITGVIGNFQKLVNDFRGGGDISNNPLRNILGGISGVIHKDFDLKTMSGADVTQQIMDNWGKFSKDAQRKVGADIGLDDALIQSWAEKGPNSFTALKQQFEDQSKVTNSLGDDARKLNIQFVQLKRSFAAAGQTLYKAMLPYVEKLPPLLEKIGNWISTHGPEIEKFFHDSADSVNGVVDAVGGWQNALEILLAFMVGKWVLGMVGAIAKVSASAGGLGGALAGIGKGAARAGIAGATVFGAYEYADWIDRNSGPKKQLSENGLYYEDSWVGQGVQWLKDTFSNSGSNHYDAYGTRPGEADGILQKISQKGRELLGLMSPDFARLEAKHHLPDGLLMSSAVAESGGNPNAVSGAGAQGLFQFMPATAKQLGINPFDPAEAAEGAARYYEWLLKKTGGNISDAIAAYNRGIGNVLKKGRGTDPLETRMHVSKVMAGMRIGAGATAMSRNPYAAQQQYTAQQPNKTDIHIGQMTVQSNATSIRALGDDVSSATRRNGLVMAYSSGQ